jgi:hypothetical protein
MGLWPIGCDNRLEICSYWKGIGSKPVRNRVEICSSWVLNLMMIRCLFHFRNFGLFESRGLLRLVVGWDFRYLAREDQVLSMGLWPIGCDNRLEICSYWKGIGSKPVRNRVEICSSWVLNLMMKRCLFHFRNFGLFESRELLRLVVGRDFRYLARENQVLSMGLWPIGCDSRLEICSYWKGIGSKPVRNRVEICSSWVLNLMVTRCLFDFRKFWLFESRKLLRLVVGRDFGYLNGLWSW